MGLIRFYSAGYWNKEDMMKPSDASQEQLDSVNDLCEKLNVKYESEKGCELHPEVEQSIEVYFRNSEKAFTVAKENFCGCSNMALRLSIIAEREATLNNPSET